MPVPLLPRYRVGNIEIDPAERCIRRDGQQEHPRARVFDLLLYFVENRDRLITKQELIERVWETVAVSDSVLYKTIMEVRRLLGDDADEPVYVKTLPKAGYRFI